MAYEIPIGSALPTETTDKPLITSYDSGEEHSLEHYVYVQQLVEEVDEELPAAFAITASAA